MTKFIIFINVFLITACTTSTTITNLSLTTGHDLDKQTYVLKCPYEMIVKIELNKNNNTFNFVKTSTASFAAGDVALERYSGKVEPNGRNGWNLMVGNEQKSIMTLMPNVIGAYVLNNYDSSNQKNFCEGALFEYVY